MSSQSPALAARLLRGDQDLVNIEASELIARLHDALKASGYDGHDLELFLVRTVFCLFADDTGIFEPRDIFLQFIEERTAGDGADLGPWLARLFQVLNTPPSRRTAKLDEDLACFPAAAPARRRLLELDDCATKKVSWARRASGV